MSRTVRARPICVTRVYRNPVLDGIQGHLRAREGAIYALIESVFARRNGRVEQQITAVSLDRDDAASLDETRGAPALRTLRMYYDDAERLLEATESIHPGDRFAYTMNLRRGAQNAEDSCPDNFTVLACALFQEDTTMLDRLVRSVTVAGLALAAPLALAQSKLDVSMPWGPTEFHVVNAQNFAKRVGEVTKGQVTMTVHPGGALGIKANESLRAVEDGTVPMAEYAAFQNVGDLPLLGIESLPFLIDDYQQLKVMHSFARPAWEAALAKRGQKVLYVVPWPSQNFFTKKPVKTMDDLKGVRMRTYDRNTAEMVSKLGMVPQQMNNPDIVPALASGRLDAVMTSGTTAAAQKYWEFLRHTYNTNHLWASNLMVINLGAWNKLSPENRTAIEKLAQEMEPEFWKVSEGEHAQRMAQLKQNGMTVDPASKELLDRMRAVTRPMWDEFGKAAGPEGAKILADYRAKTGK